MISAMIEAARLARELSSPEGGLVFEVLVVEQGLSVRGMRLLAGDSKQAHSFEIGWSAFEGHPDGLTDGVRALAHRLGVPRERLFSGPGELERSGYIPPAECDWGLGSAEQSFGGDARDRAG